MIPYFEQPSFGPVHLFGVLVVCAIWIGGKVFERRAAVHGIAPATVQSFITWILIGGFLGAHLVDRLVYFPAETLRDPLSLLRVWQGISSFGGFVGGTIAGLAFFRRHMPKAQHWPMADSFAHAFPFGWIFGRLGCFVAFDHPGSPTSFALGQMDANGVVRHNLGLEEALYTVLIAALFFVLGKTPRFTGFYLGLLLIVYAPFRFAVDALRTVDVRYFGLTPGQYGSVALVIAGAFILRSRLSRTAGAG